MKRIIFTMLALVLLSAGVFGDKITKVGIVDLNKIMQNYYFETSQLQEIEKLKKQVEEQEKKMIEDIDLLKEKLVNAKADEDKTEISRLTQLINMREDNLKEYHSVQTNRINNKLSNLQNAQNLSASILRAIEYVAEEGGFSLILNAQDPRIIWHNNEVDITQEVLNHLQR